MLDNLNKYRNKNGYIVIDKFKDNELNIQTFGSRENKKWFSLEDGRYLFKGNNGPMEEIKEIINEILANMLEIENARYDIAIYGGVKGIITKDFVENRNFTPMIRLLCKYNKISNDILTFYYILTSKNIDNCTISKYVRSFLRNHALDIFTCQTDRNYKNIGMFYTDSTLIPAPRYDSQNCFLSISKYEKVNKFIHSQDKENLIEKYKGTRTKLRVLPGSITENSINELLHARYNEDIPNILKNELLALDDFIKKIEKLDLNEIYYILKTYNIELNPLYKDFYNFIINYKIKEYEEKKVLMKK